MDDRSSGAVGAPPARALCLYAHFDPEQRLRPYVMHALTTIRAAGLDVVFVTTSELGGALNRVRELGCSVLERRPNLGFDFASWQYALRRVDLAPYEALLTLNSSVFGPVGDFDALWRRLLAMPADLIGIVASEEIRAHLQSYLLLWKRPLIASEAFTRWWSAIEPLDSKNQVIQRYEVPLMATFYAEGFSVAPLLEPRGLVRGTRVARKPFSSRVAVNPMLRFPGDVLKRGGAFVKLQLFQDNPAKVDLRGVRRTMLASGYPEHCLDDYAPTFSSS